MRKKWSWHRFWAMVIFLCLSFLKADPETRIWMQVVYLGGDARQHSKGVGKWDREGRKANKGLDHEQVTAEGNWGSSSLCDLGRLCETGCMISPPTSKEIRAFFHELRSTGWGSFLELIPPVLCLPLVQAEHAPTARKCPRPLQSCLQVTVRVSQGNCARQWQCLQPICCIGTSLTSILLFPITYLVISCCIPSESPNSLFQIINPIFYHV